MTEPKPFIDYWNEVDQTMQKLYGIDTMDAGIEPDEIAHAQEAGSTPEEYVLWHGQKYDLTLKEDFDPATAQYQAIVRMLEKMKGPK